MLAPHRHARRHGRLLCLGRVATPAGTPRHPGDRRRVPARGRPVGQLRGPGLRRKVGHAVRTGAPTGPAGDLCRPRLRQLQRGVQGDRRRLLLGHLGRRVGLDRRGVPRSHRLGPDARQSRPRSGSTSARSCPTSSRSPVRWGSARPSSSPRSPLARRSRTGWSRCRRRASRPSCIRCPSRRCGEWGRRRPTSCTGSACSRSVISPTPRSAPCVAPSDRTPAGC